MYTISRQSRFKKDIKLIQKLKEIILTLVSGKELDSKYKDHSLIGNYVNTRECHIEPDWLLIYRIDYEEKILHLIRTGSHSDLFK